MNETIRAAMDAVGANVLTEDGLLLRTCEHGVRHPVGHISLEIDVTRDEWMLRHERRGDMGHAHAKCDGCCVGGEIRGIVADTETADMGDAVLR